MLWIGTSFKMTKTRGEAAEYAARLRHGVGRSGIPGVQPFVIPSATAIAEVGAVLGIESPVLVGAQNAHWADSGAWTGEISVLQAADAGARLVEIGHSERREHFGETDATVALKVRATLRHGLIPLVCVGEGADVFARGGSVDHVLAQVAAALDGITDTSSVLVAYEPVWAIGEHGREPRPEEIEGVHDALRREWGDRVAAVLYGGSVNPSNAKALLEVPGVGGLFVGRAAWDISGFLAILSTAAEAAAV
ncbi:triose-phosphate isomerase [Streptomyces sp. PSKA54]|uniref:Triosephosphate isomerase n=1 Tax=Streptomyces himalayensis subsp. aureolus TaxID=2758039 RepID=A0A7W2HGS1_9ACTN|nr:triose-phosphate isomerase [Streptomyces himalayensis]MBA4863039.1 triose-phosphate isomerase [Streptomyces himalayensis subsp. aureolus]